MARTYLTKHVYRTPSGRAYDDRKGRVSEAAAHKAIANRKSMNSKFRDAGGRVTLRSYTVHSTRRPANKPNARTDELSTWTGPVGFDHMPDEAEAEAFLNKEDKEYVHFDTAVYSEDEEGAMENAEAS